MVALATTVLTDDWGMGASVAAVTGLFLVRLLRKPRPARAHPLGRRARIHINRAHAWLYARSGGRLGRRVGGHPVLLLTTSGRRSGRSRRTPVQYETLDGEVLIVAAAGGAHEPPAWWRNLEADPHVQVQIGSRLRSAVAVTQTGTERERLWRELCARNRYLERVQARARRELPIVRLTFGQ